MFENWGTLTSTLAVGVITLLIVKLWQTYRELTIFKRMGIPGPGPLPGIGNIIELRQKPLNEVFSGWEKKYGKIFGMFSPGPILCICDKALIRDVFVKKFAHFADRPNFLFLDGDKRTSESLLTLTGDHWKLVRNKLSPTFSSNKLKRLYPAIQRVTSSMVKGLKVKSDTKEMVELKEFTKSIALDVIAGVAFGLHVDSQDNKQDQFFHHANHMTETALKRFPLFNTFVFVRKICQMVGYNMMPSEDVHYLVSVIEGAMAERRKDGTKHRDFLQLLVDQEQELTGDKEEIDAEIDFRNHLKTASQSSGKKGLTITEAYSNSIIFLFAGLETMSMVLSMTLFALANNPEALQKATEEVDSKLGKGKITYDVAMDMNYIDMCINEAMRVFAPGLLDRLVSEDVEIGGIQLTKGWRVSVPTSVLHHDPEIFPEPLKFIPERHTAEAKAARDPFAFMPFGMGPRNCIGMRLAQCETRSIIACILQNFKLLPCDKSVYPPVLLPFSAKARDGLWIKFEER